MVFIKRTILMVLFLVFASCGNKTQGPSTDSSTTASAPVGGVFFTGKADGANISLLIADNYLSKVLKGNPYGSQQPVAPCDFPVERVEIKLTNFTYYDGNKVDIICKKDVNTQGYNNSLQIIPFGSAPNGSYSGYILCANGLYYFWDQVQGQFVVQGTHHEMTELKIANPETVFLCEGSDGKDYELTFYYSYDPGHLDIVSVFKIQTMTFTGVVSVNLRNFDDNKMDLFFESN